MANFLDFLFRPGSVVSFFNQTQFSDGSTDNITYLWTFEGTDISSSIERDPEDMIYQDQGDFEVILVTSDSLNCMHTASIFLIVNSTNIIYVPNVFSPNASNNDNQGLRVFGFGISEANFSMSVYNRWGELIWQTNSLSEAQTIGWTGIHADTGDEQSIGVYTYTLEGEFNDGEVIELLGTVTLLK